MTFWRLARPVSDVAPTPEVTGRMLAELHAVLRDYPGDLPILAPPLNDIPRGLERIERSGNSLDAGTIRLLRGKYDRLLPRLSRPVGPLQPLHGDAHAYNIITTADGLMWNDFEDTCMGPIAWDLSSTIDDERRVAAAYPNAPDPETFEPYHQARRLHAAVWVHALLPKFPDCAAYTKALLDGLL